MLTHYASRDLVKDRTDTALSRSQVLPALPAGATMSVPVTVVVARRLRPGPYWIVVCADGRDRIVEVDETNNCGPASTALQVTGPDLVVDEVTPASPRVRAGGAQGLTTVVRNQGTAGASSSTVR